MHNRAWKVCVRASRAGCGQGTTLHPPPHFNSGMAKINHFWPGTRLRVGKNSPQIDPKCEFWNVFVQNFEKTLFKTIFDLFPGTLRTGPGFPCRRGGPGPRKKSVTPEAVACSPEAATPSLYGILDIQKHEQPRKTRLLVCVLDIFDFGLLGPIYESQVVLLTRYLLLVECHFFRPIFLIPLLDEKVHLKKNFLLEFSLADQKMGPSTSHPWGFSPPNIFKALDHNKIHSCHCSLGLRSKGTNISH